MSLATGGPKKTHFQSMMQRSSTKQSEPDPTRHPVQKMTKKNVHEEPYFRSLSVSNHPPSQACSEAHKMILNLPSP